MTALQEAESLKVGLSRALAELRHYRPFQCNAPGVALRFDSAIGLLRILVDDAVELERQWKVEPPQPTQ